MEQARPAEALDEIVFAFLQSTPWLPVLRNHEDVRATDPYTDTHTQTHTQTHTYTHIHTHTHTRTTQLCPHALSGGKGRGSD